MNEAWKQKTEQKLLRELPQTDERLARINEKALAGAGCVAIAYTIAMVLYHGIREHTGTMLLFLGQLLLMVGVMALIRVKKRDETFYVSFGAKQLDAGKTPQAKRRRVLRYLRDALALPTVCGLMDLLFLEGSTLPRLLGEWGGLFVFCFLIDYVWHERLIHKYQRMEAARQAEDDEEG